MAKSPPSYRTRKDTTQAIVTLTDAVTCKRRDYWLGEYGSPESRELYHQLLAEWEANGRRLPAPPQAEAGSEAGITITEVILAYRDWAQGYYAKAKFHNIRAGLRVLRKLFGHHSAADFGPKKLRLVRKEMIRGDAAADSPRRPWYRPTINQQCRYIRHMFKWSASHEMIPAHVHEQPRTMEPFRRGRTEAHEPERVSPVADELVEAIKPHVSRQVWALIQLQQLTGARGGELFELRLIDLHNTQQEIWTASPADHKTAHHGKDRTIDFGRKAQDVARPSRGSTFLR